MAYSWDLTFQTTGTPDGASLRNRDGTAYASQPTFTLVNQGGGYWTCYTDGMPDAHTGCVRVLEGATVLTIGLVAPRETENADVKTSTRGAATDLARALGLVQENMAQQDFAWDADGNLTGFTVRVYDSPENTETNDGVTGLVASYSMSAVYVDGQLDDYKFTRVS
jgi:hypothetical protein